MTDRPLSVSLDRSLSHHSPGDAKLARIAELRDAARKFGAALEGLCLHSRERSLSITKLEECLMWGVKAIVLE